MIEEQIGLVTGIALGVILSLGFGAFSSLFSTDPEVLGVVWSGIWVRISFLLIFFLAGGHLYVLNKYNDRKTNVIDNES